MIDITSIKHWIALAAQLKSVKKQEMDLRREISHSMLGDKVVGTKHLAFGEIEVSCTVGERLSVTREDILAYQEQLTDAERECIQWKPSILKSAYDQLPATNSLQKIVTLKLGAPAVKATNLEV